MQRAKRARVDDPVAIRLEVGSVIGQGAFARLDRGEVELAVKGVSVQRLRRRAWCLVLCFQLPGILSGSQLFQTILSVKVKTGNNAQRTRKQRRSGYQISQEITFEIARTGVVGSVSLGCHWSST